MEAPSVASEASENLRRLKHDLRNPVNHILGYSDLLAEELQDPDEATACSIRSMHECGEQLLSHIEQIALPTKDDTAENVVKDLRCALKPVVRRILELSSASATELISGQDMIVNIHAAANHLMNFVETGTLS